MLITPREVCWKLLSMLETTEHARNYLEAYYSIGGIIETTDKAYYSAGGRLETTQDADYFTGGML